MIPNRRLILPYAAPYFAYVFIASAFEHQPVESNYLIRLIVVSLLIAWAWKWYFPVTGPRSALGSVAMGMMTGFAGFLLWILLLVPFVSTGDSLPWSDHAFYLRLLSAGCLVPVFEEFFIRGFVLRFALQWDLERKNIQEYPLRNALDEKSVNDVEPGSWSWTALAVSTAVFTFGHHSQEWVAAVAFSLLMAGLWIMRRDLLSCIVAHSVTNVSLAFYVFTTGKWNFW